MDDSRPSSAQADILQSAGTRLSLSSHEMVNASVSSTRYSYYDSMWHGTGSSGNTGVRQIFLAGHQIFELRHCQRETQAAERRSSKMTMWLMWLNQSCASRISLFSHRRVSTFVTERSVMCRVDGSVQQHFRTTGYIHFITLLMWLTAEAFKIKT